MTYVYKCLKCKHIFEKHTHRVADRDAVSFCCPECGHKKHKRLPTAPTKITVPPWH